MAADKTGAACYQKRILAKVFCVEGCTHLIYNCRNADGLFWLSILISPETKNATPNGFAFKAPSGVWSYRLQ